MANAVRAAASPLHDFITPAHTLVAFTGAGGKTTLMRWIADHLANLGKRVVMTTTTKIFPFDDVPTILSDEEPNFSHSITTALAEHQTVTIAQRHDKRTNKLIGLSKSLVTHLHYANIADVILVEADGAARKPLKAPNQHEPVIPEGTTLCIGVMGLDGLLQPLTEDTIHRHTRFADLTGCAPNSPVTHQHLHALAMAPDGLFKGCSKNCVRHAYLNKYDFYHTDTHQDLCPSPDTFAPTSQVTWWVGSALQRFIVPL
ncbi:selenium cofactor biosynthesis protein YqeC [Halodesulfovibrio marinisediminis]|uniref:Probable selenium-dependent hydroxylase accessory protein YqeC n=1 Tax=Halodesulfovibrio marinisediminis DSM 17456 TaxID=1121457 RepID=A0A1N6IAH7_9BACT|nr:selenium cofactor biosynthesis protein YqeC [Halodesulfovibrio marinisediminis]SIO29012.1 probable selenium-dependent hydroxylase accessory protein YqeC [Halodesulfovibrio marinisediminis DSM 17456]